MVRYVHLFPKTKESRFLVHSGDELMIMFSREPFLI